MLTSRPKGSHHANRVVKIITASILQGETNNVLVGLEEEFLQATQGYFKDMLTCVNLLVCNIDASRKGGRQVRHLDAVEKIFSPATNFQYILSRLNGQTLNEC